MKQIVLPALAAVCGAAIAYAAGPNSPVQLAQGQQYKDTTQYKDAAQYKEAPAYKMDKGAPPGAYKMDKGPGQGSFKMADPGAVQHKDYKGAVKGEGPSGAPPQYQRPDKDYKGPPGMYGQQKMDPAYGQQKMGPGGQPGGIGQPTFPR